MTGNCLYNVILFLPLLYWSISLDAQIRMDSIYTQQELNQLLTEARVNYLSKTIKTSEDEKLLADAYFLMAEHEERRFNHRRSFDYYTESLIHYKLSNDTTQIIRINRAIANRYKAAGLFSEALNLFNEVIQYYENKSDSLMMARLYAEVAHLFAERGDAESEQLYLNKAISLNENLKDTTLLFRFVMDKVSNYERLNEIDSALLWAFEAFKLADNMGNTELLSKSLFRIGYLNRINSEYSLAIKYLLQSLSILDHLPYDEHRRDLYKSLSETYSRLNDYDDAYQYALLYAALNDSILQKDRLEAMNNAAVKFDVAQKEKDIAILELEKLNTQREYNIQKRALYLLTGGLLLLLLLIYYLVRFYTQKIKTEKIISEQVKEINLQKIREMEVNMKINSMQSVIEGQEIERERIAKDLHDSLGGLLSTIKLQFDSIRSGNGEISNNKIYSKANELLDTAVAEVRSISQNLQPASLMKLGLIPAINDLINHFEVEGSPEIDFQHYGVPDQMNHIVALSIYRIIQELLHNTIKHAEAKEILLQMNTIGEELIIQFEDDGIGFDFQNLEKKGMGLDNIHSRVNYLKGSIEIDSKPGEGTSYLIQLKYK